MGGPLDGFRVVEWAVYQSGPMAGSLLGDLGADVIKIERPVLGDHQRGFFISAGNFTALPGNKQTPFEHANRNKRDVTLDVQTEQGQEIMRRLIVNADVFVTNFNETVAKRVHLDHDTLSEINPRLVYGLLTSYGSHGPDAEKRSFDTAAQARSGIMFAMGSRDSAEPAQMQGAPMDQLGGTLMSYGILAALVARERTGRGQKVENSILGAGLHLYAYDLNVALWTGRPLARHSRKRSRNPMANFYQCKDGKWLMFAEYQADRFWHDFCQAVGILELECHPDYATSAARSDHYDALIETLDAVFAQKTREGWLEVFRERDCRFVYEIVNRVEDVAADPQVQANDYVVEFDHPTMGRAKTVAFPVHFDGKALPVRAAPEFGEHTEEVLLELGYSWDEIGCFREAKVI